MNREAAVRDQVSPDMIGLIVAEINRNHTIEFINKKACEVLECTLEEVRGKDWFEMFVPEYYRLRARATFDNLIEKIKTGPSEEVLHTKKNKILNVRWHPAQVKDDTGNVTAIVITGQDITTEKSEKSRQDIINQRIGDVILLYTAEGIITYVSPSITHILGYLPQELKGKNLISFTHPEDVPNVQTRHHALLHNPSKTVRSEQRVLNKAGQWVWVEGEARNLLTEPKLGSILCNFRDISERKAAREALIKSEEKYRTLVNAMAEAVVQINLRGDILFVNKAYCELTGYTEEELIGQNCLALLIDEAELPRVQNELTGNAEGRTDHYEIQLKRKSGHKIWVSSNAAPLYDSEGNLIGMLSTLIDITQRKNAAQQLEAMNKEMTDFFYKSSHDLKGPLSSVAGLLELAKEDIKDPTAIRYCNMMGQAITKLSVTVQQVLQTIKIRDIKTELGYIDFRKMVKDVVQSLGHMPGIHELYIETDLRTDEPFYSDINTAYSILQNLVENAIKYRSTARTQSTLHLTIEEYEAGIRITAKDNGIGMSAQVLKKIFDMFFRAHADSLGTGLGLYIVKKGIDKLGGTIEVSSEENVGSTFTVYLPAMNTSDSLPQEIAAAAAN